MCIDKSGRLNCLDVEFVQLMGGSQLWNVVIDEVSERSIVGRLLLDERANFRVDELHYNTLANLEMVLYIA